MIASVEPRTGGGWGAVLVALGGLALLALLGVTVAGAVLAAPPAPLAVAVVVLPYLYAAHAAVLFGLWTWFPDRRGPPLLLGALGIAAAVAWIPGPARLAPETEGQPLRLQTWNVQRLWGEPAALACAEAVIRAEEPDVLTLLEVSAEDLERLSTDLGLTCAHHAYTSDQGPRAGGLATCVRGGRWTLASGEGQRFVDDEDWFYVFSEIRPASAPHRAVNVLAVHLYPYRLAGLLRGSTGLSASGVLELGRRSESVWRGQSDQVAALLERVRRLSDPTLIAGDFNSTRDAALHHELRRTLTDVWRAGGLGFGGTVRLFGLPLRVDHVYGSPALAVREARVPAVACSDHRPVVADFVLTD